MPVLARHFRHKMLARHRPLQFVHFLTESTDMLRHVLSGSSVAVLFF